MHLRLYTNPISPFCRAATVYLIEKSADFETVEITTDADRARLLAVSPQGEVPVLETEHGVIAGSRAICDLADLELPAPSLVPEETAARLECARLTDVACSTTDALQLLVHLVNFRKPEIADRWPGLRDRLDDEVRSHYELLEATLGTQPFFAGTYSRADIFLFMMIGSLGHMDRRAPPRLSGLCAWIKRVGSRPIVARNAQHAAQSSAEQRASADPFFRADRILWRSHRLEWACRLGLAPWLAEEIESGRAYFSTPVRAEQIRGAGTDSLADR